MECIVLLSIIGLTRYMLRQSLRLTFSWILNESQYSTGEIVCFLVKKNAIISETHVIFSCSWLMPTFHLHSKKNEMFALFVFIWIRYKDIWKKLHSLVSPFKLCGSVYSAIFAIILHQLLELSNYSSMNEYRIHILIGIGAKQRRYHLLPIKSSVTKTLIPEAHMNIPVSKFHAVDGLLPY